MKAILYHLAATGPLDPSVTLREIEDPFEPHMLAGLRDTPYPYRGRLRMSLLVEPVLHADHMRRSGGWRQLDVNDLTDEQLGRLVRRHLVELDDAGAHCATIVLSLTPDTP